MTLSRYNSNSSWKVFHAHRPHPCFHQRISARKSAGKTAAIVTTTAGKFIGTNEKNYAREIWKCQWWQSFLWRMPTIHIKCFHCFVIWFLYLKPLLRFPKKAFCHTFSSASCTRSKLVLHTNVNLVFFLDLPNHVCRKNKALHLPLEVWLQNADVCDERRQGMCCGVASVHFHPGGGCGPHVLLETQGCGHEKNWKHAALGATWFHEKKMHWKVVLTKSETCCL